MTDKKAGKIIGLCCERSVDLTAHTDENGTLKGHPRVKVIQLPCSGMIQPSQLEQALTKGASGAFVVGCAIGDCHFRTGNLMLRDRLSGERAPKLNFKKADPKRVAGIWVSRHEWPKFIQELTDFTGKVQAMDNAGEKTNG